jgi:hypothetical protein
LSGDEVIIWEIITGGFEKVASYFVKIATTCTEHVMFESSRLRQFKPPEGGFCIERRRSNNLGDYYGRIRKGCQLFCKNSDNLY